VNPKRVAPGVFQDEQGRFWERPRLNGRTTWRRIWGRSLKQAQEEVAAKRTDHRRAELGLARDPYRAHRTIQDCLAKYHSAGEPNAQGRTRKGRTAEEEAKRVSLLSAQVGAWRVDRQLPGKFENWCRVRGTNRQSDHLAHTLRNALSYCTRGAFIDENPMAEYKIRFYQSSQATHSRERMPRSAEELHDVAGALLREPQSSALGWQMLFAALTGCRVIELLGLRMDASPRETGHVDGRWLWIRRAKGGCNPFVEIHEALRECITAHHAWHATTHAGNPWWIPGRSGPCKASPQGLTHALLRLTGPTQTVQASPEQEGKKSLTAHGLRAYFVTTRRSQGISDAQIAAEIGDRTGAAIIASTYGAVPPNWQGLPGLGWRPVKGPPAWSPWLPDALPNA